MSHVIAEEVQVWLNNTRLTLSEIDDQFEAAAASVIFARVATRYDTSGWVNDATTPGIVRVALSRLIAAYEFRKAYSEVTADTAGSYADWLEVGAMSIADSIANGIIDLPGVSETTSPSSPLFWPNDTTGLTQQYDAAGNPIGGQFSGDSKFRMGTRF
jgi:hypothetical protein